MQDQQHSFVLSMLAYAAQRDVNPNELCDISGLDIKSLKKGTHPQITDQQRSTLWMNASRLTNDVLFGLHFGESLQHAALGIVGQIIKSSRTVGEALTQASALIHLITNRFELQLKFTATSFYIFLVASKRAGGLSHADFHLRDLLMSSSCMN